MRINYIFQYYWNCFCFIDPCRLKILTETESDIRTAISIIKLRLERLKQQTEKSVQKVKSLEIKNKMLKKRNAELTEHLIEEYEKRLLGNTDL